MKRSLFAILGFAFAAVALAGSPRYEDVLLSDVKEGGKAKSVYAKDTPMIYLSAKLADVPKGAKLKSDWIAVKTQVAPPNYKIDSVELTVGPLMNRANFSFSKPNAGWPVGDYRVDLFIDGKKANGLTFQVK